MYGPVCSGVQMTHPNLCERSKQKLTEQSSHAHSFDVRAIGHCGRQKEEEEEEEEEMKEEEMKEEEEEEEEMKEEEEMEEEEEEEEE